MKSKSKSLTIFDLETSQLLISSPSLKIEDEDSLYDFVRSRSENDLSFTSLFEFICFEYLSVDRIENFAFFVMDHLLENISSGIWRQIYRRLILETHSKVKNPHNCRRKEFRPDESNKLNGIIEYLTHECGGNVDDKGIVNVTASSGFEGRSFCHQKHAADIGTDSEFASNHEPDSWICYDFKERRIIPTSYSMRSYSWSPGTGPHPKSWIIEVSNNGLSWTEIDRRDNNNDLNGSFLIANFKISHVPSESFRFFRLKRTGRNHFGNDHLALSSLEIFGTLFEK